MSDEGIAATLVNLEGLAWEQAEYLSLSILPDIESVIVLIRLFPALVVHSSSATPAMAPSQWMQHEMTGPNNELGFQLPRKQLSSCPTGKDEAIRRTDITNSGQMGLQRGDMLALMMGKVGLEFERPLRRYVVRSRVYTYSECKQFHLCIFTTRDQIRSVVLHEQLHAPNLCAVRWRNPR
jgi:hypothetical protein